MGKEKSKPQVKKPLSRANEHKGNRRPITGRVLMMRMYVYEMNMMMMLLFRCDYMPSILRPTVCSDSNFALFFMNASARHVDKFGHL